MCTGIDRRKIEHASSIDDLIGRLSDQRHTPIGIPALRK